MGGRGAQTEVCAPGAKNPRYHLDSTIFPTSVVPLVMAMNMMMACIDAETSAVLARIIIIIIIIIWFGDTVTVSHSTKCDTNSKVRALS